MRITIYASLRIQIRRLNNDGALQFIGNAVNSKEAKLHSIVPEPSSALITCIRDSCSATSLLQKEFKDIRGAGFMFKCHGHFQHFWDADTKKLF